MALYKCTYYYYYNLCATLPPLAASDTDQLLVHTADETLFQRLTNNNILLHKTCNYVFCASIISGQLTSAMSLPAAIIYTHHHH